MLLRCYATPKKNPRFMLGATFSITAASHEDLIEVAACKGVAKNLLSFPLASQIV